MAVTVARDLIRRALQNLQLLGEGQNPSGQSVVDGLKTLNQLIETWSLESLILRGLRTVDLVLTPGQQTYTWGAAGDINEPPPNIGINGVYLLDTTSPGEPLEYELKVLTDNQWEGQISLKNIQSSYPHFIRFTNTYPTSTFDLYPIPSRAQTLRFRLKPDLVKFGNANTSIDLQPGMDSALEWGLAAEMGASYGVSPDLMAWCLQRSAASKRRIKTNNFVASVMSIDPGMGNLRGRRYRIQEG